MRKTIAPSTLGTTYLHSFILLLAAGSVAVALTFAWRDQDLHLRNGRGRGDVDDEGDDCSNDCDISASQDQEHHLPSHIQRELYKDERRKASVRFLAMKKPMYDNIEMYGPDDVLLCTIGKKKADWYVYKKKLAVWRTPLWAEEGSSETNRAPPSIRLLFEPKSKQGKLHDKVLEHENNVAVESVAHIQPNLYNITHKKNICVACGIDTGLMRHYVVPYAYRRLLPTQFKSHLPHDIVLLCLDCHVCADQAAVEQRDNVYEPTFRKDSTTALAVIPNRHLRHVKSCAQALWKHRDRMPPQRVSAYEDVIQQHVKKSGAIIAIPSEDLLRDLAENLETDRPNPGYVPIAELVVQSLHTDRDVSEFIRSWRRLFLETLQPRYLPVGWSVDSPVENDS
jgi:exonuclease 3'-5' domain-containing protein 2